VIIGAGRLLARLGVCLDEVLGGDFGGVEGRLGMFSKRARALR
jgi:hypothetical protein